MTLAITLKKTSLIMMAAALAAAMVAAQFVSTVIAKAIGDTKAVRVAPATACNLESEGAHFTGCSSLL